MIVASNWNKSGAVFAPFLLSGTNSVPIRDFRL